MAHLLGSKYCIESLQSDVQDLQSAVSDVFSRVGPVRYPSWKFPDKISCDVDVDDLLEQYSFTEDDDEDCQVAHISLFELTIDRMLLLLQSFTRFTEQVLSGLQARPATAGHMVGGQMSIGLVVKKYWNKMVQLNATCQKLQAEVRVSKSTISKLEAINTELQHQAVNMSRNQDLNATLSSIASHIKPNVLSRQSVSFSQSPGFGGVIPPNNGDIRDQVSPSPVRAQSTIASDTRTIACQTLETAFVPCEACSRVQLTLLDVSGLITHVCQAQNLPSAIAKYRAKTSTEEAMSASDIARWGGELNKDLDSIKTHLQTLLDQISPLQDNLTEAKKKASKLETEIEQNDKNLKKEKGAKESQLRQHAAKLKEVEREHAQSVLVVQRNYEETYKAKKVSEDEIAALKRELQKQCEVLKELDTIKSQLTKDLEENLSNKAAVVRLESQVQQLTLQVKDTSSQLEISSKQLGKEQARNRSVDKHTKALQNKHDALVQRVDELDQECQELRDSLADVEDARDETLSDLKETQEEVKTLKDELHAERELVASIKEEKQFLETSIQDLQRMILALESQLGESQDREKMLVQYPDLNPGLNVPQPEQGNKPSDMKQQVQSNNIRIQILEEQNNLLRKNIGKLLEQRGDKAPSSTQMSSGGVIPLWQQDTLNQAKVNNARSSKSPRGQPKQEIYTHQNAPLDSRSARSAYSDSAVRTSHHRDTRQITKTPSEDRTTSYVKPPRPPSGHRDNRAKSASSTKRQSSAPVNTAKLSAGASSNNNASLSAYIQLKNSGAFHQQQGLDNGHNGRRSQDVSKPPLRPQQGWTNDGSSSTKTRRSKSQAKPDGDYQYQDSYTCSSCDKMYSTERDLDIHKSYCTG